MGHVTGQGLGRTLPGPGRARPDGADQAALLSNHFFDWFDEFVKELVKPSSLVDSNGAPVTKINLEQILIKYNALKDSFLSKNVFIVDNDKVKIQKVMDLIPDLRLYFTFGHIKGLFEPDKTVRPYLSIIKGVTKKLYTIERSDCHFAGRRTVRYVLIPIKIETII